MICSTDQLHFFNTIKQDNIIKGIFVGHDHVNDYSGYYKNIYMAYGRKTGRGSYNREYI